MLVRQEVLGSNSACRFCHPSIFSHLRHHSFGISRPHLFRNDSPCPATYSMLVALLLISPIFNHSSFELNRNEPHVLHHRFFTVIYDSYSHHHKCLPHYPLTLEFCQNYFIKRIWTELKWPWVIRFREPHSLTPSYPFTSYVSMTLFCLDNVTTSSQAIALLVLTLRPLVI